MKPQRQDLFIKPLSYRLLQCFVRIRKLTANKAVSKMSKIGNWELVAVAVITVHHAVTIAVTQHPVFVGVAFAVEFVSTLQTDKIISRFISSKSYTLGLLGVAVVIACAK